MAVNLYVFGCVITDPPRRADGLCARDGCDEPVPTGRKSRADVRASLASEPFCSTDCCKLYHGLISAPSPKRGAPGKPYAGFDK